MSVYNAKITTGNNSDDVLHLSRTLAPLGGFPAPIVVRTSADLKASLAGFRPAAAAIHSAAADHGRAIKGRILYISTGSVALSFLAVHVPPNPGPIICDAFASVSSAADWQHDLMRLHLLAAAQELSAEALQRAGKVGKLAWATNDPDVRDEMLVLGFNSTPKPKGSDCDRTHYLEATFD